MNRIILIIALYFASLIQIQAEIPPDYYTRAAEMSGEELKSVLNDIIKAHQEYPYSSSSTDTWDILKESDKDTANPENVILFYSGWSVNAAQEFNNGAGWNREHVWARSRGDFGTSPGPGTDAHHLRPTDISVNAARDSRWFDTCSIPYLDGGMETGCFTSNSRYVWQPRDAVKGDVARIIFYMATRYEGENGEPDLRLIDILPADDFTNEPVHAKLSALLNWHMEDPVDDFERNRNEVIYGFQNNRNPFIDHPEYAERIWGSDETYIKTSEAGIHKMRVYPNPFTEVLILEVPEGEIVDAIELFDLAGRKINFDAQFSGNIISLHRGKLSPGIYIYRIDAGNIYSGRVMVE